MSLIFLLINVFIWAGLRGTDILVVTLLSALVGFAGWLMAFRAGRKIRRMGGRVAGEAVALIAYWGNLAIFLLSSLMFAYSVAMGILRGDLL